MVIREIFILLCLCLTYAEGDVQACRFRSSEGLIDLGPLANSDNTPRFKDIRDPQTNFGYSWNPCNVFNEESCQGVEVCQIDVTNPDNDYVLGTPGEATFLEQSPGKVVLVYRHESPAAKVRITNIQLVCDLSTIGKLEFNQENPPLTYQMTLTSQYACPMSLTTPSNAPHTVGPGPGPGPSPGPDIFSIKTITILLACILLDVFILIFLVFVGLITRRR